MRFTRFVAIDWSGAKGRTQSGIQVAEIGRESSFPRLLPSPNGRKWSRQDVAELITGPAAKPTLFGLDFAFSVPWRESCGRPRQVKDTKELWALVDLLCIGAPHMYAGPIWTSAEAHFFVTFSILLVGRAIGIIVEIYGWLTNSKERQFRSTTWLAFKSVLAALLECGCCTKSRNLIPQKLPYGRSM